MTRELADLLRSLGMFFRCANGYNDQSEMVILYIQSDLALQLLFFSRFRVFDITYISGMLMPFVL